jgi:hypothetical protein
LTVVEACGVAPQDQLAIRRRDFYKIALNHAHRVGIRRSRPWKFRFPQYTVYSDVVTVAQPYSLPPGRQIALSLENLRRALGESFVLGQMLAFPLMVQRFKREWHVTDRAAWEYRLQFGKPIQDSRQHHPID